MTFPVRISASPSLSALEAFSSVPILFEQKLDSDSQFID